MSSHTIKRLRPAARERSSHQKRITFRNSSESEHKNKKSDELKMVPGHFIRTLWGKRELKAVSEHILTELTMLFNARCAVFYFADTTGTDPMLKLEGSYAADETHLSKTFRFGDGLIGQCAVDKKPILMNNVPLDYVKIRSGLVEAAPVNIVVLPILYEDQVLAVIELASFDPFTDDRLELLDQISEIIGVVLYVIQADRRMVELSRESEALVEKIQKQQQEIRRLRYELEEKEKYLSVSKEVDGKQSQDRVPSSPFDKSKTEERSGKTLPNDLAEMLSESVVYEPDTKIVHEPFPPDASLSGKTVMIADGDVRNVFMLTGVLGHEGISVIPAYSANEAISLLNSSVGIDAILVDMMMPGCETIQTIRSNPKFSALPIIAINGRGVKGDREKCIEAGASDYIAKPVNTKKLMAMLKVWIVR